MTSHDHRQAVAHLAARQQALAEFGLFALRSFDLDAILAEACAQVCRGLNVPMAKVGMLLPSQDLLLKATLGIPEDIAVPGVTVVPGGAGSALGYALLTRAPVLSDVETETRFDASDVVRKAGVKSSANVVIMAGERPFGSLEADSRQRYAFDENDIDFLQSYANLVGAAVERQQLSARAEIFAREQDILLKELVHRVKNILTNIRGIAYRTRKYVNNVDDFLGAFDGRLNAIARSQDLVLHGPQQVVQLADLVRLELTAKGAREGENFSAEGPPFACSARLAQVLGLLFYELATNANKYGALSPSAPDGHVQVAWRVENLANNQHLVLTWRERGVTIELPVRAQGFGSEMIREAIPYMFGGSVELAFHADGVECRVSLLSPEAPPPQTAPA
jgi:two-component sensor histidine kinase